MLKNFKEKAKGLITGVIIGSILTGGIAVFATQGNATIDVFYNNIKLIVDGILVNPTDAGGNTVEPFIYNGTTYLPVRAIGNALGKNVSWDGDTSTVYLGETAGNTTESPSTPIIDPNFNGVLNISMSTPIMGGDVDNYIGTVFHVKEVSSLSADATTVADLGNFTVTSDNVVKHVAYGSMGGTYGIYFEKPVEVPNVDGSKPYKVTLVSQPTKNNPTIVVVNYDALPSQYIIVDESTVIVYPSVSVCFYNRSQYETYSN